MMSNDNDLRSELFRRKTDPSGSNSKRFASDGGISELPAVNFKNKDIYMDGQMPHSGNEHRKLIIS